MREIERLIEEDVLSRIKNKYAVRPLNEGQAELIDCIDNCSITICSGCAGTGKTHLSVGKAFEYFREGKVKKIILIRPIQECGRNLGAMPGDKKDKLEPHMAAFSDLFHKFMHEEEIKDLVYKEILIMDALEFLRGKTYEDCFVIVDEAQNATYKQLRMILTRIGKNSKMVITGDGSQTDLDYKFLIGSRTTPLEYVMNILEDEDDDIGIVDLYEEDIVRHGLVAKICKLLPPTMS